MRKIIDTCDKCGKTNENEEVQFWSLRVSMTHGITSSFSQFNTKDSTVNWCRGCVVKILGFLPSCENDPPKREPEPSAGERIEELLRDMVFEEVQSQNS